jgi:hypothetical protein
MGEEGEATMGKSFTESFESRGGWTPRSPTTAVVQRERDERERKERRGRRKGPTNSLIGALQCYKGASESADVARLQSQLDL